MIYHVVRGNGQMVIWYMHLDSCGMWGITSRIPEPHDSMILPYHQGLINEEPEGMQL